VTGPPRGGRSSKRSGRRSPARHRLEIAGLLLGLAAGFSLAFTWLGARGGVGGSGQPGGPGTPVPVTIGSQLTGQSGGEPNPAALDAEWAAYSDRSSCADWAGGDGVSAVSLSPEQIAWFFSDTYLGPAGPTEGFSRISGFLHNSVVIQTMTPNGSKFVTMTGGGACSAPGHQLGPASSVVGPPQAPGGPDERYWDEDGITIGGTVVKFYNSYLPGGAPFVGTGTVIAAFGAGQLSAAGRGPAFGAVARPRLFPLPSYTPPGGSSPIMWGAALLRAGNTVYVYGTQTPDTPAPDRQLYLARVPASRLTQFAAWQFYAGAGQWAAAQQDAQPVEPAGSGLGVSTGFSVVRAGPRFWLIQADPVVGSRDIDAYPADAPWGPFDPAAGIVLFRNDDVGLDAAHDWRIMYEARAEPALSTPRALVISYNVNSIAVTAGCVPMSAFTNTVTLPRFITVPLAVFGGGGGAEVAAGASDYPRIAVRDPSQWFDEWDYPSGCPPVPGVGYVQARPRSGAVLLSWPDAGLGVRYQVYVLQPGSAGYLRETTVRSDSATVSGLRPGTYLARVVPANLKQGTGPAAQTPFTVP
jgi:hypothetical protein